MNIAIIGTGAMGSLLAVTLQNEHNVVMIGRWAEQVNTIRDQGLTLIDSTGTPKHVRINVSTDPSALAGQNDVALLAVKSAHTLDAANDALAVLTLSGLGITIQNGLGNLSIVQRVLGNRRATLAVTSQGATLVAPGVVRHAGVGPTTIGRVPELGAAQDTLVLALCDSFNLSGWPCTIEDDVDAIIWTKLAINAAINPLTAILGVSNGALLERPEWVAIMNAAGIEVATVANAIGIALNSEQVVAMAEVVARDTSDNYSSMLQDVQRGVPTEIEAISGAVVDEARTLGIPVPVNETLLFLVRQIDEGRPNPQAAQIIGNLAPLLDSDS